MTETNRQLIVFGPVPSRRLGRSLGINNIPPKSCSYSCLYCQVGTTRHREIEPRQFFSPQTIVEAVTRQVEATRCAGKVIDYLTFVPDGEPTLDINLGKTIELLRPLDIKIAVISNASLLWRDEVCSILSKADWVSLKVDTVVGHVWQQLNQPHPDLYLSVILQGIQRFAKTYKDKLVTETMLVAGVNDEPRMLAGLTEFIRRVNPDTAYLAIPTRPPAQPGVHAPDEYNIVRAFEILNAKLPDVQYLIAYEGDDFVSLDDPKHDLLAIIAVHPMREEAMQHFLVEAGLDWFFVEQLINQGKIMKVKFAGHRFYMRRPASQDFSS